MSFRKPVFVALALWACVLPAAVASYGCVVGGGTGTRAGQQPAVVNPNLPGPFGTVGWQTVTNTDASLRFEMPGMPTYETETARTDDGRRVTRTSGTTRSRGVIFGYRVTLLEQGIGGRLLDELDALVDFDISRAEGSEIQSAEAIWLSGHPGTELRLTNAEQRLTITMRHYIGRSRAYVFLVGVPQGREAETQPALDHFFGSVVLDRSDAPSANGTGRFDVASSNWRFLYPPEGYFSIELPGDPMRSEDSIRIDDHAFDVFTYSLVGANPAIAIEISTVAFGSRDPDGVTAALDARVMPDAGRVVSRYEGARGGYAMRRLEIAVGSDVRHAMIVQGSDGAHLITVTGAAADEAAIQPMRERILASFLRP